MILVCPGCHNEFDSQPVSGSYRGGRYRKYCREACRKKVERANKKKITCFSEVKESTPASTGIETLSEVETLPTTNEHLSKAGLPPGNEPLKERDHVDQVIEEWSKAVPTLNLEPFEVMGRIQRSGYFFDLTSIKLAERYGLKEGEYYVVTALRRVGPPYQRNPTELKNTLLVAPGTITKRLDRLEALGYIERKPDPDDRRGIVVGLTRAGVDLVDRIIEDKIGPGTNIVNATLSFEERRQLAHLLRKLLLVQEKMFDK